MNDTRTILILGASYGSLLGSKLLLAGHDVTLVCLPEEAELINRVGTRVRLPVRGRDELVEIASPEAPGRLSAATPDSVDPADFDLIALAMQEPQYRAAEVRRLLERIGASGRPVISIMNMPPLPFMKRITGLDCARLAQCYSDVSVWDAIDPRQITLASPDPQAFRPPAEGLNVLQVSLPTNFKVARFEAEEPTALLRQLEADIAGIRYDDGSGPVELPVKLKVHQSLYVPMAKWSMLLTGNYRCITPNGPRAIRDAVHADPEASRSVYDWVGAVCQCLGASADDLVPFEKYAAAAQGLAKPSSAARALFGGAPAIERVDRLVQSVGAQYGMRNAVVDDIVALVDERLGANRRDAA